MRRRHSLEHPSSDRCAAAFPHKGGRGGAAPHHIPLTKYSNPLKHSCTALAHAPRPDGKPACCLRRRRP
ncbi:hypothetical protein MPLSOD_30188 [Mesorhizobium sp. SOD10]|nr:hypothetical protein MPLSOD_30188 [Mesorhizobium sp. SOD10]